MSREDLALAFRAVSVDSLGDVYQAAEPDWSLADKLIAFRANEARLIADKRAAEAAEPAPIRPHSILGADDRVRTTDPEDSYDRRGGVFGFGGGGGAPGGGVCPPPPGAVH